MRDNYLIVSAQPSDIYFCWQIEAQLHNFRKFGISDKYHVLVYTPYDRLNEGIPKCWSDLMNRYPETKFFFYKDSDGKVTSDISSVGYIPLLRPFTLKEHWRHYPVQEDTPIFYLDSDVLFTRFDFERLLLLGNYNYLSDTRSYLGLQYWDSKWKDAIEGKKEEVRDSDFIGQCAELCGVSREIFEENNDNIGGAQYILKGVDYTFWDDVYKDCIIIYSFFGAINRRYFESENKGYQRWCADMVAILFNLWKRKKNVLCPPEMDFMWATDPFEKTKEVAIYHHAGACSSPGMFDKRNPVYTNNITTPFKQSLDFTSFDPKYGSYFYTENLKETKESLMKLTP